MPMIQVHDLKKWFRTPSGLLRAVNGISFHIEEGETLGLVGESGCGKSTMGRSLLRLEEPSSGEILFKGENILTYKKKKLHAFRRQAQMIFQDPYASLNPRMTIEDIIAEPLKIHGIGGPIDQEKRVAELLDLVGLDQIAKHRFPHEFSGGQRQRIGIARAFALNPKLIVCDEPISALDVSIQAQIVNLLKKLQKKDGLTYLFIAHDLAMIKYISDRVAVMYLGHIVELGSAEDLYTKPLHPYTQALLSAIPIPDPTIERSRTQILLQGELPSPLKVIAGCPFASRCPSAMPICHHTPPKWEAVEPKHFTACHLHTQPSK